MRMETSSSPSRQSDTEMAVDRNASSTAAASACGGSPGLTAPTYHFKILVPAVAAGAIIGKKGKTIAQMQKDCGARVEMSKSYDFYPNTNERVCLITGTVEGIVKIHNFIMDKIKEKLDPNSSRTGGVCGVGDGFDHKQPAEREKQVKILVPNSTADMIAGEGGSYIKQITEDHNVYIQLSSRDHALAERSITIIGESEPTRRAVDLVLAKIVEDPQNGSCLNVSYADAQGPVANFNLTGFPYANPTSLQHSPPGGLVNQMQILEELRLLRMEMSQQQQLLQLILQARTKDSDTATPSRPFREQVRGFLEVSRKSRDPIIGVETPRPRGMSSFLCSFLKRLFQYATGVK